MVGWSIVGRLGSGPGGTRDKLKKVMDVIDIPGVGYLCADEGNHKLLLFQSDGTVDGVFGPGFGDGPSSIKEPCGLAVYDGTLFVVDKGNARIQCYSIETGEFLSTIVTPKSNEEQQFMLPTAVLTRRVKGRQELLILECVRHCTRTLCAT